jgi:hypothetical protein
LIEASEVLKRLTSLKEMRKPWEPLWKDITDFVLPRRSFWDIDAVEGQKPQTKIYDGTAIAALQLAVDGLLGSLVNQVDRWFRLAMEDKRQQNLEGVADWLEEAEDIVYAEFSRSNFYESISEYFLDACSIGTASMFVEDDITSDRMLFSTRHIKECFIAESKTGMVDTLYRDYVMTNRAAGQMWGNKLPLQRQDAVRSSPYAKANVVHAVFPRSDRVPGKIDGINKPYASVYIDKDHAKIIDVGGYDEFPYLVWRWRKNSDEVYGRSPAADAIQDILRINQVGKSMLQAAQLAVEPPLNVPDSMKGTERIVPRGYNYYPKGSTDRIEAINLFQNYPIGKDQEESIKEQIRENFRTRVFLLMEQLERGNYTATEIIERQGEKAAVLGATIGRLNSECLIPLIDRAYKICERKGLLPPPPQSLMRGGRIHVEFQGPLAMAQKRYHQTKGVQAGVEFLGQMMQLDPQGATAFLDNADMDELARIGMDASGIPQKVIRELSQVIAVRKARQEAIAAQQKQAQELEQQKLLAGNVDKLNQPMQPDSMLAGLAKGGQRAQR